MLPEHRREPQLWKAALFRGGVQILPPAPEITADRIPATSSGGDFAKPASRARSPVIGSMHTMKNMLLRFPMNFLQVATVAAVVSVFPLFSVQAQDPYLPVNPSGTLMVPEGSTIPGGTTTIPGTSPSVPSGTFSVPSPQPAPTVVTPGTAVPNAYWVPRRGFFGGWSTNYGPRVSNYNAYALPYGGGCSTCPGMRAPSMDFGLGYDGFMTGW